MTTFDAALAWGAGAALLAAAEIAAPGFYLLWLGIAAGVTAIATGLFGLPLPAEFVVFALAAVASILVARRFVLSEQPLSDDPFVNERAARLIGREVEVVVPLVAGEGRVRLGDTTWLARGPDLSLGTRARVGAVRGGVLEIEALPEVIDAAAPASERQGRSP